MTADVSGYWYLRTPTQYRWFFLTPNPKIVTSLPTDDDPSHPRHRIHITRIPGTPSKTLCGRYPSPEYHPWPIYPFGLADRSCCKQCLDQIRQEAPQALGHFTQAIAVQGSAEIWPPSIPPGMADAYQNLYTMTQQLSGVFQQVTGAFQQIAGTFLQTMETYNIPIPSTALTVAEPLPQLPPIIPQPPDEIVELKSDDEFRAYRDIHTKAGDGYIANLANEITLHKANCQNLKGIYPSNGYTWVNHPKYGSTNREALFAFAEERKGIRKIRYCDDCHPDE
jgi:hypothetical protein